MPWKVRKIVTERMAFVSRLERGERMSDLCRGFGISRKTGYKILDRFRRGGAEGLFDQSRRPERSPQRTPEAVQDLVLGLKKEYPTWGPKKLKAELERREKGIRIPAHSTIGELLARHGLVNHRRRRPRRANPSTNLRTSRNANELWCADFKGEFRLGNRKYCYPLTISDNFSRYLLACEGLESTRELGARAIFVETFREFGLPTAIRTDNGAPFASTGLLGLTKLSVWWLRLGIELERIEPGHPEQNGRHERIHLTLKEESTRPAGDNHLQQQEKLDTFREAYNEKRPHEALAMKRPAEVYMPSERAYPRELPEPDYPLHDKVKRVKLSGEVKFNGQTRFHLSIALAGEMGGLREVEEARWLVSFLDVDLGHYDERQRQFEPIE